MKLRGDDKWSLGSCVKALPNRSYEVEVAGRRRQNRRQLRMTAEAPPLNFSEPDDPPLTSQEAEPIAPIQNSTLPPRNNKTETVDASSPPVPDNAPQPTRRSSRVRKPPLWHKKYYL